MKKAFVKNPYLPAVFGQNKTLNRSQNNVVINTELIARKHSQESRISS